MSPTQTLRSHFAAELRGGAVADDQGGPAPSIRTTLGTSTVPGMQHSSSDHYRDPAAFACSSPVTFHFPNAVEVQR